MVRSCFECGMDLTIHFAPRTIVGSAIQRSVQLISSAQASGTERNFPRTLPHRKYIPTSVLRQQATLQHVPDRHHSVIFRLFHHLDCWRRSYKNQCMAISTRIQPFCILLLCMHLGWSLTRPLHPSHIHLHFRQNST